MKKNLMLIEAKEYNRKDGTKGAKLIFLDKDDTPFVGYCDPDIAEQYKVDLSTDETFNPTRAREYEVVRDVFNGTMTTKVQLT